MPFGFGPYPGPRQIPIPGKRDPGNSPKRTFAAISFETDPAVVASLLPPGFRPSEPASVSFDVQHLEEIDWLAGRSYSTAGVRFGAVWEGKTQTVEGDFLAVLWENLADPILSGREELGYAKLWCDIAETVREGAARSYRCSWLGHSFFDMELTDLVEAASPPPQRRPVLHYKYIPRTGCPGQADAEYATMTPAENPEIKVLSRMEGSGTVRFHKSTWEQLPTLFHIVNPLSDLPLQKLRSATLTRSVGGKDLSDQTILE